MLVRNRNTTDVMTEGEFRAAHSNTSFPRVIPPELLDAFGFDPVLEGAQPTGEPWQYPVRDGVEEIEGQWFTKYVLGPTFASQEEEDSYVAEWQTQQGLSAQQSPRLVASAVFAVTGAWPDTTVDTVTASGIAMAFAMGDAQFWVLFNEPQVDLSYGVYASASGGYINVVERTLDYVELCVKDGGAPFIPSEFSVNIVRST